MGGVTRLTKSHDDRDAQNPRNVMIINVKSLTSMLFDTGYPHDGCADNAAYRHDRRADKRRYPHDREIDIQM